MLSRDAASDLEKNWEALKQERRRDRTGPTSRGRVGTVLRFLGLPYQNENDLKVRRNDNRFRWVHFTFETDPQSVVGIGGAPQFGSLTNGTYHVYCLWEEARSRQDNTHPRHRHRGRRQSGRGDCNISQCVD